MQIEKKIRKIKCTNEWMGPTSKNLNHQFASAFAQNIYNSKSIYSFIPKCACSTMRLSIAIANGLISDKSKINWIHSNNETFSANLKDLVTADFTFVILRNPFLRIASTYLDKIVNTTFDQARVKESLLKIYSDINVDELTFKKFIELISINDTLRKDIHWQPQSDFLVYENYDLYVQFENFKAQQNLIEEKCNLKIYDARNLTLHGNDIFNQINDKNHTNTKPSEIAELRKMKNTPSLKSLYDKETKEMVTKLFLSDIRLYNNKFKTDCSIF
tara:strand:+ start:201 stop:1019 length:819 start_codon:yes stop_codon:yes gene_type:complete